MEIGKAEDGRAEFEAAASGGPPPFLVGLLAAVVVLGMAGGLVFALQSDSAVPVVAAVSLEEAPEAIETLTPAGQQAARSDPRGCRVPMGFVTVSTPGNPSGGTVSFRTSRYKSPSFQVNDKPQRIAIPLPVPPETGGVDLLSVDGNAKGLRVSLTPTALMEPVNGLATVKVRWLPRPPCRT